MAGANVTINQLPTLTAVALGDSFPAWSATGASTYEAFTSQIAKTVFTVTATALTLASGGNISSSGGNFILGGGVALATNATAGYVLITTCAGTPSGVPVGSGVGSIAMQYDTTNNKFWVYAASGAWRGVALT